MTYSKKELRQAYIARLQQLDLNTRLHEEKRLTSMLFDQPEWMNAKVIATTLSQSLELDTSPIILHARHENRQIVVPRTLPDRQMEFVALNEDTEFVETTFGILEPKNGRVYQPDEIDLMIVPGKVTNTTDMLIKCFLYRRLINEGSNMAKSTSNRCPLDYSDSCIYYNDTIRRFNEF